MSMPTGAVILFLVAIGLVLVGLTIMPTLYVRTYHGDQPTTKENMRVAQYMWIVAAVLALPFFLRIVIDALVG